MNRRRRIEALQRQAADQGRVDLTAAEVREAIETLEADPDAREVIGYRRDELGEIVRRQLAEAR